jgi:hypothetical protein
LDSGATIHIVNDEALLRDVGPAPPGTTVRFGNGPVTAVARQGTLDVTTLVDGRRFTLSFREVLCFPGMSRNLLSMQRMIDQGCTFDCGSANWSVQRNGRVMARFARAAGGLRVLIGQTSLNDCTARPGTALLTELELQHERTGHCSPAVLKQMHADGLLPPATGAQVDCMSCAAGKQRAASHPARTDRATAPMQLWHADLQEPEPYGLSNELRSRPPRRLQPHVCGCTACRQE